MSSHRPRRGSSLASVTAVHTEAISDISPRGPIKTPMDRKYATNERLAWNVCAQCSSRATRNITWDMNTLITKLQEVSQ
ncbi:hypothetical protein BV22DRAFT_6616 [Leucogyrophana mollusca]|uniref:Uncharacterized protein n=1 Tax=Leucogyrophana mollusca TaxID=85980 RepID=A0ACB8C1P3_9AGAM|nr:hypothetical protein BV22DRAFT_6616 [Leucogyrophana mollusca]